MANSRRLMKMAKAPRGQKIDPNDPAFNDAPELAEQVSDQL